MTNGNITKNVVFCVITSFFLSLVVNKSNFPSIIMIPIIASLISKYLFGDFDIGYQYSTLDVLYWVVLVSVSAITVQLTQSNIKQRYDL